MRERSSSAAGLVAFAGLCAFGVAHWGGLVAAPPTSKLAAVVAIAAACAAGLAATARLAIPVGAAARLLAVVLALGAGLVLLGLEVRLLLPGNWDELGEGLDQGLAGLRTVEWPYDGSDEWVRLTLLLGAPVLAVGAAAAAFWPVRHGAGPLRLVALALLLLLYGVPVTERDFRAELVRGAVLALLIAVWLWAPRARLREAGVTAAVVGCLAVLAIPAAAALDRDEPWIDYRQWNWFGAIGGTAFDWSHSYGPITWSRDGTTLLRVKSARPLYLKVETLDSFDGFRWGRSGYNDTVPPLAELPERASSAWEEELRITVRNFRSDLAVVTGQPYRLKGVGQYTITGDGTTRLAEQLREGDTYTVSAYVPKPSADALRAARDAWPLSFRQYLIIGLPAPGVTNLDGLGLSGDAARSARSPEDAAIVPFRGQPDPGAEAARELRASPYRRTYALARRLAAGERTTYDVVRKIERHLLTSYSYSEQPPSQEYPLEGFLFEDRAGYCQQFSGAMGLMLRMLGIPARVVGGFAPGSFNRDEREFRVRDLDAHSWVEVWFDEIGWVQFDPTPSAAPAQSRSRPDDSASSATGSTDPGRGEGVAAERQSDSAVPATSAADDRLPVWMLPLALGALAGLVLAGARLASAVRRGRGGDGAEGPLRELIGALRRLGYPVPPRTTLLALERRLARVAGPGSAEYVRTLRVHRYGGSAALLPDGRARKRLRRELVRRQGLAGRVRGWLALPPFRRA